MSHFDFHGMAFTTQNFIKQMGVCGHSSKFPVIHVRYVIWAHVSSSDMDSVGSQDATYVPAIDHRWAISNGILVGVQRYNPAAVQSIDHEADKQVHIYLTSVLYPQRRIVLPCNLDDV